MKYKSITIDFEGKDTCTITRFGTDDYDIYFHNGDCSVRGTATDILEEFCNGNLSEIKQLAYDEWSKGNENPQLYVEDDLYGMALTNPWMDSSSRFELTDADALEEWGMESVFEFCTKAKEVINED